MKNSIIAVDLDETLLDDNGNVSKQNKQALKQAQKMGATIVVSTSRNYPSSKKIAKQINADYVCAYVGNMIVDKNGNIIYKKSIPQKETTKFVDTFYSLTQDLFVDSEIGMCGKKNDFSNMWTFYPKTQDELRKMTAYKFFIMRDKKWDNLVKDFCEKHNFVCMAVRNAPYWFIFKKQSDKFNALKRLQKLTGKKTLFVFGDDFSDLKSIENATYGVAMANSRPEILTKAKHKTTSNNDSGIANFLQSFLKK